MSNKTCVICYNKHTNENLKCKMCKNEVCDICYANIIYNNSNFQFDFKEDKSIFSCPFCKHENILSTSINNYNTNNKLIKLLLETMKRDNIEFNNLVDDINILRKKNYELQDELNEIKNVNKKLSSKVKTFKNTLEYKPSIDKLKQIENLIQSTKKHTILYIQIYDILNK